jgi:hypothetical protein
MDKKIVEIRTALQKVFGTGIEEIAHKKGFVQRLSKLTGLKFVEIWVMGFMEKPNASLNYLVQVATDVNVNITKQGLQDRLSRGAVEFLMAVLERCTMQLRNKVPIDLSLLKKFSGVQIVDSSEFGLPDSLQSEFPGSGGDGPKSIFKLQVIWDFLHGNLLGIVTQDGRQPDQSFRQHALQILPGWLCLSDLGYFALETLEMVAQTQAYFISRWLTGCGLLDPKTEMKLDLLSYLQSTAQKQLELNVWVGFQKRLACRLLAIRLSPEIVEEKRRRLRDKARRKGRTVSATSLAWLEWSIFITNVPLEWLTLEQASLIYRLRWQIELLFKLWKSECQIDRIAGCIRNRVLCEIYAKLIGSVIFQYVSFPFRWTDHELSPIKAVQTFRRFAISIAKALEDSSQLDALLSNLFDVWQRCGFKDKHKIQLSTCQRIALAGQTLT